MLGIRGFAPFVLPSAMHAPEVAWWVGRVTGGSPPSVTAALQLSTPWVLPLWGVGAVALLAGYLLERRWSAAAEWTAAAAALALLPPVTAFLLWFLVAHSPRHLIQVTRSEGGSGVALRLDRT